MTALASLGTVSCGGRISGENDHPEAATEVQIMGACFALDGAAGGCGEVPNPCECGAAGTCDLSQTTAGRCVPRPCQTGYYLDSNGECDTIYWFLPLPGTGACYGAPPLLG